jgi:hypothetical protein
MPSFPYVMEKIKDGFVYRPKIPVTISYSGNRIETYGFIDSGSDITILPKEIAKVLGIELTGRQAEIGGIGGGLLKVVIEFVNLDVGGTFLSQIKVHIPTEESKDVDQLILGHEPLFQDFNINFEYNAKRIVLNKIRH